MVGLPAPMTHWAPMTASCPSTGRCDAPPTFAFNHDLIAVDCVGGKLCLFLMHAAALEHWTRLSCEAYEERRTVSTTPRMTPSQ